MQVLRRGSRPASSRRLVKPRWSAQTRQHQGAQYKFVPPVDEDPQGEVHAKIAQFEAYMDEQLAEQRRLNQEVQLRMSHENARLRAEMRQMQEAAHAEARKREAASEAEEARRAVRIPRDRTGAKTVKTEHTKGDVDEPDDKDDKTPQAW